MNQHMKLERVVYCQISMWTILQFNDMHVPSLEIDVRKYSKMVHLHLHHHRYYRCTRKKYLRRGSSNVSNLWTNYAFRLVPYPSIKKESYSTHRNTVVNDSKMSLEIGLLSPGV